jgi:hypothetical protein
LTKDLLTLERHGIRTLPGLSERILQRLLCLAAAITLNPSTRPPQPRSGQLLRLNTDESIVYSCTVAAFATTTCLPTVSLTRTLVFL